MIEVWSDLHHEFKSDGRGELKKVINVDAVLTSIDNILGTRQGERVMLPQFASTLSGFLFDPIDKHMQYQLADSIRKTIEKWDDRVAVAGVDYFADPDRSFVNVSLTCRIRGYSETFQYNVRFPVS